MNCCCYSSCRKPAEFRIIDTVDPTWDTQETYSCEEHVGPLLGHSAHLQIGKGGYEKWDVLPLPEGGAG